jgi:hypothetical protein
VAPALGYGGLEPANILYNTTEFHGIEEHISFTQNKMPKLSQ